jgi:hypothetical protein
LPRETHAPFAAHPLLAPAATMHYQLTLWRSWARSEITDLESAVLKWAQLQPDKPSKAEAIRRLVAQALAAKGVAR